MLRSILSIIAGFVVMAVLVTIGTMAAVKIMLPATDMRTALTLKPTPVYLAVDLIYSAFFAAVGGFTAAVIAGRSPGAHALALAGLMLVMGLVSFFQNSGNQQPPWYGIALLFSCPLCAIAGGYLQSLRQPQ